MKKVLNNLSNIFVWAMVIAAVGVMIFTIISVNTFDRRDRELFGYSAYIVMSDSMSKTDFDAGDIVIIKNTDPTTLQEGDIIAYISQDKDNYGATVTHKIRKTTTNEKGEPGFITYGTTTGIDDTTVVTYSNILGKYQGHIPKIGSFFHFLKTIPGYIIFILTPFALLLVFQGINCVKAIREYREEQMKDIKAEIARLEEERRRTEATMLKLQEMKQQFGDSTEWDAVAALDETGNLEKK